MADPLPTHKIVLTATNDCCGVFLLSGFHKHHNPYVLTDWSEYDRRFYGVTQKTVDDRNSMEYTEDKEKYKARIKPQIKTQMKAYSGKKSYLTAYLNTTQIKDGAEEVLLELGWEVVIPPTRNPTGSEITMYAFHLLPRTKTNQPSSIKRSQGE